MTISMYQASAPVLLLQLNALSAMLDKAEAFAAAQGIDPATLIEARIAPDMFAFARQVQIASDMAKGGIARLAGREAPSYADDETSFAELKARIARTIAFIGSVEAEAIDGSETRPIVLKLRNRELALVGQPYLLHFVLPNFFFHVTTAYAILRAQGVPLAKADFLGGM